MMSRSFALTLLATAYSSFLTAQTLEWAVPFAGTGEVQGFDVAVDADGYVYSVGYFEGTVDLDPGPDELLFTAVGSNTFAQDIYATKLDPNGNLVWAYRCGGNGGGLEWGRAIAVDASGNVYIAGHFEGSGDFDPGPGTVGLSGGSEGDGFLVKLNAAGDLVWAKKFGGNDADRVQGLTLDAAGNVYCTGHFNGNGNFSFGSSVVTLNSGDGSAAFVYKVDPTGTTGWVKQLNGGTGLSIVTDAAGYAYTIGNFFDNIDLDPGAATSMVMGMGSSDIFISKLDNYGDYVWGKTIGGPGEDWGLGIAVDGSGNVYGTGHFRDSVDFDPGAGEYMITATEGIDSYLFKLNALGELDWAHGYGVLDTTTTGTTYDTGYGVVCDAAGNVYAAGTFAAVVDFDHGADVHELDAGQDGAVYLLRLDVTGAFTWAIAIGADGWNAARGLAIDPAGQYLYATGAFYYTADFDPNAGYYPLAANNQEGGFVLKLDADLITGVAEGAPEFSGTVWPNPTNGRTTLLLDHHYTDLAVIVYDQLGQRMWQRTYGTARSIDLDMDVVPGIYMVEVIAQGEKQAIVRVVVE